MRVLSVINEKGGVGKSSVSINLAYGFADAGKKVLLVDFDPQHNVSSKLIVTDEEKECRNLSAFAENIAAEGDQSIEKAQDKLNEFVQYWVESSEQTLTVSDVLKNPEKIKDAIVHTKYDNLDLLPSTHELSVMDYWLKAQVKFHNEDVLASALKNVKDIYDVVIIDNSPFESALTYNSINCCKNEGDLIIIPTKIDRESFEGLSHTLNSLIEWLYDPRNDLALDFRILPSMVTRTSACMIGLKVLKDLFKERVLESSLRYQVSPISQSSFGKEVLLASKVKKIKNSGIYKDYENLVKELL